MMKSYRPVMGLALETLCCTGITQLSKPSGTPCGRDMMRCTSTCAPWRDMAEAFAALKCISQAALAATEATA